jgi:hypothetical protein
LFVFFHSKRHHLVASPSEHRTSQGEGESVSH